MLRAVKNLIRRPPAAPASRIDLDLRERQASEMRHLLAKRPEASKDRGPVLFWVPGGMPLMLHVEAAIAAALELRGVRTSMVICNGPFKACVKREAKDGVPVGAWGDACTQCYHDATTTLDMLGLETRSIGDFVSRAQQRALWEQTAMVTLDNVDALSYGSVNVGTNVRSAIVRYLKGAPIDGYEDIVREYAYSALVCACGAEQAIRALTPSRMFMSHGVYVDWGPALHTAQANGVPVTAWMASYLPSRFYFRHLDDREHIDFHCLSDAAWSQARRRCASERQIRMLDKFLDDRYVGKKSFDMKEFKRYTGAVGPIRGQLDIPAGRKVFGILCHINWDAVCDYAPMVYPSFDEWILDTLREIVTVDDVTWLVKIHPAEAWDNPLSGVDRLIQTHYPSLPPHVKVISPEAAISPRDFIQLVDGGVTAYGTAGLELALHGKPVILSGSAHYGGKGFTYDSRDRASYLSLLRQAVSLQELSAEQLSLARSYGYAHFIQRQVPLPVVRSKTSIWWQFQHDERMRLLPGHDPFVDFICDRLLDGSDFLMDDDLVEHAERIG